MAGSYPDVPGPRIPYDTDGTVMVRINEYNVITQKTQAEMLPMNNELSTDKFSLSGDGGDAPASLALIFPRLMDLNGMFFMWTQQYSGGTPRFEYSTNTTDGFNGTWTTFTPTLQNGGAVNPNARTNIHPLSLNGIRALKVHRGGTGYGWAVEIYTWHIYGTPSSGQTDNMVDFWHPTLDQRVVGSYFDFGDVTRGYVYTKDFRVKNYGPQTANDITLSVNIPTNATTSLATQMQLSNGGAYSSSISVGTLAPGAISSTMSVRYTVSATGNLGLWYARILPSVSSWS